MHQIHRKKLFFFIAISCGLSWSLVGLFHFLGLRWNTSDSFILLMIYMLMPGLAAAISVKFIFKERLREKLGLNWKINKWWFVAWLLPVFIAVMTMGVSLAMPGVEYTTDLSGVAEQFKRLIDPDELAVMEKQISELPVHPFWMSMGQGLIAGFTINAAFALGEEAGWRGYMLYELKSLNFWKSSGFTGIVWGIWHFPVILMGHNYFVHRNIGVLFMIIFCMLLSPIAAFLRIKANSVFAAAIFHGTINATASLALLMVKGGNDLTIGVTGISGFIVLSLINLAIYLKFRNVSDLKPV
jgi:membrane protease YdiL (CAAX protease family)